MKIYAKIENNFHLSNKQALFYNMRNYYTAQGIDPFNVLPVTFHVKKGVSDPMFIQFLDMYNNVDNQRQKALKQEAKLKGTIQKMQNDLDDHLKKHDLTSTTTISKKTKKGSADKAKEEPLTTDSKDESPSDPIKVRDDLIESL